ncbi:reverse transcriptase domain-containing protein [Tanacetum coccineum]|uniref:Reverse transcriptase domain-containing protein n=1 Tax=Tanacetum coccineum TaxID=301880 RepID=A0ABQ5IN70_9ASTR
MLVEVGKFTFPVDFVILEMKEDSKVPLIFGRPFLHTEDALIRVKQKQLNLGVHSERMIFSIDSAMKYFYSNDDTYFSIDVIDEILEEDFDALLDEGSKILYSIERTPLEDKLFAEFDEFIAMNIKENHEPKINEEELPFEIITFDTEYKIKKSLDEVPTDLELKHLLDHLEYAFLEEPNTSKPLLGKQQTFLVSVHLSVKEILNPNIQEVDKEEILKLLKTGIIYPIADSPWVSLIYCVPKKGGIIVVTNENNELVPTRTITGWYCIVLGSVPEPFRLSADLKIKSPKLLKLKYLHFSYAAVQILKKALGWSFSSAWFIRREKDCFMPKEIKQSPLEKVSREVHSLFLKGLYQDFQNSSDVEEDTRSSHEYLNDFEEEYQTKALLAKSKRFFKKGTQRFGSAKATGQTECHKYDKKGHFARDC